MSEPKRIFISHSSKNEAAGIAFRDQIIATIRAARDADGNPAYVALVDRDMAGGDEWRPILYNWMLLCDAAVILLDPTSTNSNWVPREAMVFRWRHQVDPSFRVIPVLRGVNKDIFAEPPFREMGLDGLNYVDSANPAGLLAALQNVGTSCDIRLQNLEQFLTVAPPDPHRFLQARPLLDLDEHQFLTAFRPERAVAASLLGYGFRQGPFRPNGPQNPGAQALSLFSWLDKPKVQMIFSLLCPYWVDRAAAGNLFNALRDGSVIVLRLNLTQDDWPARAINAYVRQACSQGVPLSYKLLHIDALSPSAGLTDELTYARTRVRSRLLRLITGSRREPNDADQPRIDRAFQSRNDSLFLWASDEDQIKLEHLIQVQKEMPYLRIIYLCSDASQRNLPGIYYVVPELDSAVELAASTEFDSAVTYFPETYELYQVV